MPWFTNKETGGKFNTDWLDEEYKRQYIQIHFNQDIADKLNEQDKEDDFTKQINSILGKPKFNRELTKAGNVENRILECYNENKINPNWSNGYKYHTNCSLCTTAIVLQARGYDVEAMPRDDTWRGVTDLFRPDYSNPDNYMLSNASISITDAPSPNIYRDWNTGKIKESWIMYKKPGSTNSIRINNPPITPKGANAVARTIIDKVHKWGPGSVGAISVLWKNRGSAHSVSILNLNGRATIYDGQINKMFDEDEFTFYFKRTTANTTSLLRLDNADWIIDNPNLMGNLKKMVKRRDG